MRRRVRIRLRVRVAALGFSALLVAAPAARADVRLGGVASGGYPQLELTVVGSRPSTAPPSLTENGRPVQGLRAQNFGSAKAVVLAIDRSRSMAGAPLAAATEAARAFVRLKGATDRVGIVQFGRAAAATTGLSAVPDDALTALRGVSVDARTGTALYDAVVLASKRLAAQPLPGRVLVLLTDGDDVSSSARLADAVTAARRAHVAVYAISAGRTAAAPLRALAEGTGGSYREAGSADLERVYAAIASELGRTWRLRYTTSARPGERLTLRVASPLGAATAEVRLPAGGGAPADEPPRLPGVAYSSTGTIVVGLLVFALVATALVLALAPNQGARLRSRLDAHVARERNDAKRHRRSRSSLARSVVRATERTFAGSMRFRRLERLLERAGMPLKAAEFVYIQLGAAILLGLLLGGVAHSSLVALAGLVVGAVVPYTVASFKARQRLKAFEDQLPDLMITLAASLKAGHSFRQGIQAVVEDGRPPASDEFRRVLTETSLGRPMEEALQAMAERVGSKDLDFVITSVTIQRQVGGSLAGLFDMVAEAVRQRQQFARKIRGLTAMGKMSARVLIALPFLVAAALSAINPAYMTPLYHTQTGRVLIGVGLTMMAIGNLVLRKMVSFKG